MIGESAGSQVTREDINYDFRKASAAERLCSLIAGDPVADYQGFPLVQKEMLEAEVAEHAEKTSRRRMPIGVEVRHRSKLAQQDRMSGRPETEIRKNLEHLGVTDMTDDSTNVAA